MFICNQPFFFHISYWSHLRNAHERTYLVKKGTFIRVVHAYTHKTLWNPHFCFTPAEEKDSGGDGVGLRQIFLQRLSWRSESHFSNSSHKLHWFPMIVSLPVLTFPNVSFCVNTRFWSTCQTQLSWTTRPAGCPWRSRVKALNTAGPTMPLKLRRALVPVRATVRDTAKAIRRGLGRGMEWERVKLWGRETGFTTHPKTLWLRVEAMESSLTRPKVTNVHFLFVFWTLTQL